MVNYLTKAHELRTELIAIRPWTQASPLDAGALYLSRHNALLPSRLDADRHDVADQARRLSDVQDVAGVGSVVAFDPEAKGLIGKGGIPQRESVSQLTLVRWGSRIWATSRASRRQQSDRS